MPIIVFQTTKVATEAAVVLVVVRDMVVTEVVVNRSIG